VWAQRFGETPSSGLEMKTDQKNNIDTFTAVRASDLVMVKPLVNTVTGKK
jgi:hypothetical protein